MKLLHFKNIKPDILYFVWKSITFMNFIVFLGFESSSYRQIRVKFRGESFRVYGHQLSYWVSQDFTFPYDSAKQISHLCHLASCVKPEHLTYETSDVNNARKLCKDVKVCFGHGDEHLNCIMWIPNFMVKLNSSSFWRMS